MNAWSLAQDLLAFAVVTFLDVLAADVLMSIKYSGEPPFLLVPLMRVVRLLQSLFLPALISMVNSRDKHSMVSPRLKRGSGGEGGTSVCTTQSRRLSS